MKNTYLLYKDANAKKKELVVATQKEWDTVLAANRKLPREQRRFFIRDCIENGSQIDCMFIETSRDEYNKWHSQEVMRARNRKAAKDYQVLSLDYAISDVEEAAYGDTVADPFNLEEDLMNDMFMANLRATLAEWKDWANELLDYYLAGKRMESTRILSEKYGVSFYTIQKRKNQLDQFIKNYLKKF